MILTLPKWYQPADIEGVEVSEEWEPGILVSIRSIQVNLNEAATTDEDITAKILNASGDTIFNFGTVNPLEQTPETEFTMVPEERSAIVPADGSLVVAFLNTDDIDPIIIIVGYSPVELFPALR